MCIIEDLDFFFQCCVYDFLMLKLRLRSKQSSTFERMREFLAHNAEYTVTTIILQLRISVCKRFNFDDEMYVVI